MTPCWGEGAGTGVELLHPRLRRWDAVASLSWQRLSAEPHREGPHPFCQTSPEPRNWERGGEVPFRGVWISGLQAGLAAT